MAFADITKDNIQDLLTNKDSKETKRQVNRAVRIFRNFLLNDNVNTKLESLSNSELFLMNIWEHYTIVTVVYVSLLIKSLLN